MRRLTEREELLLDRVLRLTAALERHKTHAIALKSARRLIQRIRKTANARTDRHVEVLNALLLRQKADARRLRGVLAVQDFFDRHRQRNNESLRRSLRKGRK